MRTTLYITNTLHTLVKGGILCDEQFVEGYFLIDSASNNNVLNLSSGIKVNTLSEKVIPYNTLNNQEINISCANFVVSIEGMQTEESMSIMECNHELFNTPGLPILGILGISYLVAHKICIDYENMSMYTIGSPIELNDFKIKCPFAYGITHHGIAVVGLTNGVEDNVMMTILDTGSNLNIVCNQALGSYPFNYIDNNSSQNISDVYTSKAMDGCIVECFLLVVNNDMIKYKSLKMPFYKNTTKDYLLREEGCKQIEAIIGSQFMISNKCILDFSTGNMYSTLWE